MAKPLELRVPWGPLEEFLLARFERTHLSARARDNVHDSFSLRHWEISMVCGVSQRGVERWLEELALTEQAADRAASALGVHPTAIWGDAWWVLTDPIEAMFTRLWAELEEAA